MEAKITMDRDGAHVASQETSEKLKNKKLSASLITALSEGCSASWLANSFAVPDVIEEDQDNPAVRGSLFHKIMEEFFALPPEERSHEKMRKFTKSVLHSEDFVSLASSKDAVKWLKEAINNYYRMGGKPHKVNVARIKDDYGKERIGLEVFVKGKIGDTNRDILGFIDQVLYAGSDSTDLIVQDWKTGAKAKKWNPKTKSTEGLAEHRQQIIYSMLLEQKGYTVSSARLVYPVAQEVVGVDLTDEKLKSRVVDDVEKADRKLSHMEKENLFEYSPSFLCAWCPLAKICPSATIKPYQKMQDAVEKQPELEDFKGAIRQI